MQRIDEAVDSATELGDPHALSQALGMRAMLHFMRGDGLDRESIQRAWSWRIRRPTSHRPSAPACSTPCCWPGPATLDLAHEEMLAIRRRCIDSGEEGELSFIDFHSVLIDLWRGAMAEANLIAEDTVERAFQLNGDLPLSVALTVRAAVAAYAGDEEVCSSRCRRGDGGQ